MKRAWKKKENGRGEEDERGGGAEGEEHGSKPIQGLIVSRSGGAMRVCEPGVGCQMQCQ